MEKESNMNSILLRTVAAVEPGLVMLLVLGMFALLWLLPDSFAEPQSLSIEQVYAEDCQGQYRPVTSRP